MIKICGYSDDVVYIDGGHHTDEIDCFDRDVELTLTQADGLPGDGGLVVTMRYVDPGIWSAELRQTGEDQPIPWPVRVRHLIDEPPTHRVGYTVAVEIDARPDDVALDVKVLEVR